MALKINDADLQRVFRSLWEEFKVSAEEKKFLIFPAEKIEVLSGGKINFDSKNGAQSLREGLRQLGVTMYHLATGYSERNKASLAIDGYPEIETELWPVVSLMLSGQAFSIPQIDEMIGWKTKLKKSMRSAQGKMMILSKSAFDLGLKARSSVWNILSRSYPKIKKFGAVVIGLLFAIEMMYVGGINVEFSSLIGAMLLAVIFAIVGIYIYVSTFCRASNSDERVWRRIMNVWFFPSIIITMILYAGTTFVFLLNGGVIANNMNSIIIERDTGKFVGRVPTEQNKDYLVFNSIFLNQFKYKVIPGLPIAGSVEKKLEITSGDDKLERIIQVNYNIVDGRYADMVQKYGTQEVLEKEISQNIDAKLVPAIKKRFDDYANKARSLSRKNLAINISGDVVKDYNNKNGVDEYIKRMEEGFRNKVREVNFLDFMTNARREIKNIGMEGVALSLTMRPPEAKATAPQ